MIAAIRQKIIDTLESQSETLSKVYRTKSTFEAYPAAVVLPSPSESDYGDTAVDRYTFVFRVDIYYPIKNEDAADTAEKALEACIDEMIILFGKRESLKPACDWVMPAPTTWGEEVVGDGNYRRASITLRAVQFITNRGMG